MAEGLKVRYRQGSDTTTASEEYWVVAKPGMPEKWREDPTIPLTHVMQSFDIFRREGASGQAPRSDLMYASVHQLFLRHNIVEASLTC
jgi:hypothetical protein